jgi:4-carboxymuconolactone decarboxylase
MGALSLFTSSLVQAQGAAGSGDRSIDLRAVSPALDAYAQQRLFGELWQRPGLSPRDRGLVTLAALIARNQQAEMARYMERALDSGVKPGEVSEAITHLAFYSGWGNAIAAVAIAREVFARRGVTADQLPPAVMALLPINEAWENNRATTVEQNFGTLAPGVVKYTTDILFRDLWLRPALAPRDRSMVTVSALIATGQVAQLTSHLNLGMDNGLKREEISEMLTHLAFYAGWPNVFSAMPVAKAVFEKRG